MIVPPEIRHALPDQLRGFALLGIVLVNMPFLALGAEGFTDASLAGPADRAVAFLIVAFAQGKFYLLFAFLFGYSLTLLLRDSSPGWSYARRLLGLFVLGAIHAIFFFIGDILMSYAVLGALLVLFLRRSTRTVLIAAAAAYGFGLTLLALIAATAVAESTVVDTGTSFVLDPAALDTALRGTFLEAALGRLEALPDALIFQAVINAPSAFAMFLLGLAAGRAGILAHPERYRRLWWALVAVAVAVGAPLGVWSAVLFFSPNPGMQVLGVAVGFGSAPILTGGYLAAFALTTRSRIARAAEPAGRMSLTVYLSESIILSAIFCGWGLGILGTVTAATGAAIAVGAWIILEVFAKVWLGKFRYGPFEWALRCITKGHWVSLRSPAPPSPTIGS